MSWVDIISLAASIIALIALWGNISAMWYNIKHFRKGGYRVTFHSGAYQIKEKDGSGKIIFSYSPPNSEGFKSYTTLGMNMHLEEIKPFWKWSKAHWVDDIRTPNYPLELL